MNSKYLLALASAIIVALASSSSSAQRRAENTTGEMFYTPETEVVVEDSVTTTPPAGQYVFIPDSLINDVNNVLSGRSKIVRDESIVDLDEKIVVGNDTVNLILKERNLGRFSRGLFNYMFIPRKTWQFGLTASYGDFDTSDIQVLDLLTDFDFKGHTFSIKPSISYFIRNNISVGVRFGYTSTKADLGALDVDIDEDLNFSVKNAGYKSDSFAAALTFRQYIGIARKGRFGIFNGIELSYSRGTSDFNRLYDGEPKLTQTLSQDVRLSFSPGICVFVMKNVSFNVSFGVMGFYLHNEKQKVDGEDRGNRFTSGANFKFNIFNIDFGLGIHI